MWAACAAALLHGAVLAGLLLGGLPPGPPPGVMAQITLLPGKAVGGPAAQAPRPAPKASPAPVTPPSRPAPAVTPPLVRRAVTRRRPVRPRPVQPSAAVPASTPPAVSAAAASDAPASDALASGAPASGAAAPMSTRWEAELAAWLAAHRLYPQAARRDGIEGRVVLRMLVARDGTVDEVVLVTSSGAGVLDRAALDVVRGAHVPAFPPEMTQASVRVTVPLRYVLSR